MIARVVACDLCLVVVKHDDKTGCDGLQSMQVTVGAASYYGRVCAKCADPVTKLARELAAKDKAAEGALAAAVARAFPAGESALETERKKRQR